MNEVVRNIFLTKLYKEEKKEIKNITIVLGGK